MRVNEVISRCRTDQSVQIYYDGKYIEGTVFEIVAIEGYRLNRISDMIVTGIISDDSYLILRTVKAVDPYSLLVVEIFIKGNRSVSI